MAKKVEIKAVAYVHVGDKLVNTDDLNDEQRLKLTKWLKCTYLNAMYQGKARFFDPEDEPGNSLADPHCTQKAPPAQRPAAG